MRKEINSIVRNYAKVNGNCFEESWNKLYKFYNKVCHKNIKARVTRRRAKTVLDVIESDNDLEILKILAENLFVA